ncbi:hypothetical protein CDL15_Pgr029039 [Punica granatum]|uniref:Uncharacterized protein n=1 Tax=Punica granatum TaxID=22663 RepID=A0A218XLQ3_PUNGR|nr:hypothetical protein CDL15_Pgr029039 [Punica granatum]
MAFVPEDEGRFRNEWDVGPLYDDGGLADEIRDEEHRIEANRDVDEPAKERIEDIRDVDSMADPVVVSIEDRSGEDTLEAFRVDVKAVVEPVIGSAEVNGGEIEWRHQEILVGLLEMHVRELTCF